MADYEIIMIDGGLSTELESVGFEIGKTRLWTAKCLLDKPDLLKQAHINFLKSGSQIIETSSYQMSIDGISAEVNCSPEEARQVIRKSVEIAIEARKLAHAEKALVAGSVGPYGACQCDCSEYDGSYATEMSKEFLMDWHRPRIECLLDAGCDLLAIETIPSIKEAAAILDLLAAEFGHAKAWLSFSARNETQLCNGQTFANAYNTFKNNKQLIAVGINCSSPAHINGLLKSVTRSSDDLPFVIYTNFYGKAWEVSKEWRTNEDIAQEDTTVEFILRLLPVWIKLGAKYVGGCCNFSAMDMAKIRATLDDLKQNHI